MEWVVIVTALLLAQFTVFGFQVGQMRARHNVKAPAISGAPEFERMYRIHYNTMEQLVLFLPLMGLFAYRVDSLYAAGFGVVFFVGRLIYRATYLKDPAGRGTGFTLTLLPSVIIGVWLLVDAVRELL